MKRGLGLIRRVVDLFRSNGQQEENPEWILGAFIEASTEKLRELQVSVSRVESDRIQLQERVERAEAVAADCRSKAAEAVQQGDDETARRWLTQAHTESEQAAELRSEADKLNGYAQQLKEGLDQLRTKLETAKGMREQWKIRLQAAGTWKEANQAFRESSSTSAMRRLQEETFLAEAKAELSRNR